MQTKEKQSEEERTMAAYLLEVGPPPQFSGPRQSLVTAN